jgi:hypothetical protein
MKAWMRDWGGATVVHAHTCDDQHDRPLVPMHPAEREAHRRINKHYRNQEESINGK